MRGDGHCVWCLVQDMQLCHVEFRTSGSRGVQDSCEGLEPGWVLNEMDFRTLES